MEDIDSYFLEPTLKPTSTINIKSITQNMQYINEYRKIESTKVTLNVEGMQHAKMMCMSLFFFFNSRVF